MNAESYQDQVVMITGAASGFGLARVVRAPGENFEQEDIKARLQQFVEGGRINKWAIPRQIRFLADIPKTSVGKINKKLIRESLLAELGADT